MPGNLTYSQARIPFGPESPAGPTAFSQFGGDIDQLLVLKAASTADRDAKYAGVSAGTLVSCAALGVVWQKVTTPPTAAAWLVVAQNSPPVTSGMVTAASGWSTSTQWGQKVGGMVSGRLSLINGTGADITSQGVSNSNPGDMADTQVGTLDSSWMPPVAWPILWTGAVTVGSGAITTAGAIMLYTQYPSGKIRAGDAVNIMLTGYPAP